MQILQLLLFIALDVDLKWTCQYLMFLQEDKK